MHNNSAINNLRVKMRDINNNLRNIESRLNSLESQSALYEHMLQQLHEKISRHIDSRETGLSPDSICDVDSLLQYAEARFGSSLLDDWQSPDMKQGCVQIRDSLANEFSYIQRFNDHPNHPDYPDVEDDRHADAFLFYDQQNRQWVAVDFCRASTAPGRLSEKLTWQQHPVTLW